MFPLPTRARPRRAAERAPSPARRGRGRAPRDRCSAGPPGRRRRGTGGEHAPGPVIEAPVAAQRRRRLRRPGRDLASPARGRQGPGTDLDSGCGKAAEVVDGLRPVVRGDAGPGRVPVRGDGEDAVGRGRIGPARSTRGSTGCPRWRSSGSRGPRNSTGILMPGFSKAAIACLSAVSPVMPIAPVEKAATKVRRRMVEIVEPRRLSASSRRSITPATAKAPPWPGVRLRPSRELRPDDRGSTWGLTARTCRSHNRCPR